ncbi:AraC family transcriptional regulator [Lactobacillus sp. PSON]|uniref:AraC family transcriptional regulator n=1 Tax=Lactobacillus sp. PSON TaxID=3455454 RepID=UPI0040418617
MNKKLLNKLMELTDIEKEQLKSHKFYSDYTDKSIMSSNSYYKIPVFTEDFFKNQKIYISKHNRYADYPNHTHTFLEMNYMINGHATEYISGEKVVLNSGDILILDVGTSHSINALGSNDLLLNIIFKNDISFSLSNIRSLGQDRNIISKFLLANSQFSKYLIYRCQDTEDQIQIIANQIIEEYYNPQTFSKKLMDCYLNAFMILLSRNTSLNSNKVIKSQTPNLVLYMLKEISKNPKTVSLNLLAEKTNYNRSYLGSLFKKETGQSFSYALTEQRLLSAYDLLSTTDLPITDIIEKIGISNKTFFYKKFEEKFNTKPSAIRNK